MSEQVITRRRLIGTATAAGVAGAALPGATDAGTKRRPRPSRRGSSGRGGIHIHVTNKIVRPALPTEWFVHTFILTLWGPDHALSGIGCGFTEGNALQNLIGTGYVGCVFGAYGHVDGDVVRGKGVMMYSGDPDEKRGQPFPWEAHLSTGFCRFTDMNLGMGTEVVTEGTGTVTRI